MRIQLFKPFIFILTVRCFFANPSEKLHLDLLCDILIPRGRLEYIGLTAVFIR
jgi:hypothetical protein